MTRRKILGAGAAALLSLLPGCGMLLHPERRNQPPGGGLDWKIVALDGLGLLLFFIPGVIAFAVDFATGAIFLPPPGYGSSSPPPSDRSFVTVSVPKQELTRERLEQVASQHTGRDVRLVAGEYQTAPLAKIDDFWPARERLVEKRG